MLFCSIDRKSRFLSMVGNSISPLGFGIWEGYLFLAGSNCEKCPNPSAHSKPLKMFRHTAFPMYIAASINLVGQRKNCLDKCLNWPENVL